MIDIESLLKLESLNEQLSAAYEKRISSLEEQNHLLSEVLDNALTLLEAYDKMRAIRLRKLFFYSE